MQLDERQKLVAKVVGRFVIAKPYPKYPGLSNPFVLDDGHVYATDGKAMIVLDKNIIGAAMPVGDVPSVETLIKSFPDRTKSAPLRVSEPTLYESDPCSGCGGSGKCQCDAEDEAECEYPCPHCNGESLCYTESRESVCMLKDGKQELRFKRSLLHKLDDLGDVTFKFSNKSGAWSGYFFFPEGRAMIIPESEY